MPKLTPDQKQARQKLNGIAPQKPPTPLEMPQTPLQTAHNQSQTAPNELAEPSENTKQPINVKTLFGKAKELQNKHTATKISIRTVLWMLAILAIPAYGIYAINYKPSKPQPNVSSAMVTTLTPLPTKQSIPTPLPTNTPTPTPLPTATPTPTATPFPGELYIGVRFLPVQQNWKTKIGLPASDVVEYGAGCPVQWALGTTITLEDGSTYLCVDRYARYAFCSENLCSIYVFSARVGTKKPQAGYLSKPTAK